MHGGDHPVDRGLRPFDMRFDGAVGQVPDLAGEAQRGSGLDRPVAVEHALDASTCDKAAGGRHAAGDPRYVPPARPDIVRPPA